MTEQTESTLVLIKPDAVERRLAGSIIRRFESEGLRIDAIKMMWMDRAMAERHYAEHEGEPFYGLLVDYIISGPIIAMVLSGPKAIKAVRDMIGNTDPQKAHPGTIRGQYATKMPYNVVHASDSKKSATREISLFFEPDEIMDYDAQSDKK